MERVGCLSVTLGISLVLLLIGMLPVTAYSDVLAAPPPDEDRDITVAVSLEAVISYERQLTDHTALLFWTGLGTLWALPEVDAFLGVEAALELRRYFVERTFSELSVSSYLGVALMDKSGGGTVVAVTPGIKVSWSGHQPSHTLYVEPYVGISYPMFKDPSEDDWDFPNLPHLTLGLRLVFEHFVH